MKQPITKAHKERFAAIARNGCMAEIDSYGTRCGMEAQVHHVLKNKGMGRKNDHEMTFGLCAYHHTGDMGIHQIGRKTWQAKFGDEEDLLELANEIIEADKQSRVWCM